MERKFSYIDFRGKQVEQVVNFNITRKYTAIINNALVCVI